MKDTEKSKKLNPPSITSWNSSYIEDLYRHWSADPKSLDESWNMFFKGFEMAMCPRPCVAANQAGAQSSISSLIFAFRSQGHLIAKTDPLENNLEYHPSTDYKNFGFEEKDLHRVFDTGHFYGPKRAELWEIIQMLKETYCQSIGVQYTHIQAIERRRWLQERMESVQNKPEFSIKEKKDILKSLTDAEMFENFIQTKYPGHKRFSLQGAETLIPAIHSIVLMAPDVEINEIVIGMAHRGRLNILANILDKSYEMIFTEFDGYISESSFGGDGDVKYHLGFSGDHVNENGKSVHVGLVANPSHLEAVDPVVLGKTRAKQRQLHKMNYHEGENDNQIDRRRVLPLIIHGDAAFSGQGLVSETLNLSQLKGYKTGGTIHFIINNQIGFTTDPIDSRSSAYCTDVAKMIDAPIFHVNGDDPEAVIFVTQLALKFRQEFQHDVVIDMVCYRRFGHNEADEPAFTQPLMYKKIKKRPSVLKIYTQKLFDNDEITEDETKQLSLDYKNQLKKHFHNHDKIKPDSGDHSFEVRWENLDKPYSHEIIDTTINYNTLVKISNGLTSIPLKFSINAKIARIQKERKSSIRDKTTVDWAFAESLAFGSLLNQNIPIRLSGQDSARGTFSQRHSEWRDIESSKSYIPLNHIEEGQAEFCVYNSPLSEAGVLGFDYGYSLAEPGMLIIWEAQFGDFANGAQPIIDQFIISSQSKWQRTSGLVMLLPHGNEGQGAEHSNAYLERYLMACAEDNIQVCNLSTPAQYFHVLRRQMLRPFRRPLIIMAPKSMLRNKMAVSSVNEFTEGCFQEVLDDPASNINAKKLLICSGKIFYDLIQRRSKEPEINTAIVRVEQFYPLNSDLMSKIIDSYSKIEEIVWVQEESKNRGGWSFINPWLRHLFPDIKLRYVGRGYSASPATGSIIKHQIEQEKIMDAAFVDAKFSEDINTSGGN